MSCRFRPFAALVVSWSLIVPCIATSAVPRYTITDLGHGSNAPVQINNVGQIAIDEFLWTAKSGRVPIPGTSPGFRAEGINNKGQVVGTFFGMNGGCGLLPCGEDINDAGIIVAGSFYVLNGSYHPLTSPPNGTEGWAINTAGDIVGDSAFGNLIHATRWHNGKAEDLGTLPGDDRSSADGINDHGTVVGQSWGSGPPHAFIWTTASGMQELSGGTRAWAINDQDWVVGEGLEGQGLLWKPGGEVVDLRSIADFAGMQLVDHTAFDINEQGQIVGVATTYRAGQEEYHVILLTPVPEPAECLLLAIGILLVALRVAASLKYDLTSADNH
jgi:probable HAF family extracellular repeat protein